MNTRSAFAALLGLALLTGLTTTAIAGAQDKEKKNDAVKAAIGEPAPDFTLTDTEGKSHRLSDYKGKIVVLQWINPQCPVCRRVWSDGLVGSMRDEMKKVAPDIVHLTINSTHFMEPSQSAAYLKEHKIDVPALDDRAGTVGRLYGARTTPHMYVIDQKGILRYDGAFDDDARGREDSGTTNYVVNAVKQIVAGETVTPDTTRPYGCSVKYGKN